MDPTCPPQPERDTADDIVAFACAACSATLVLSDPLDPRACFRILQTSLMYHPKAPSSDSERDPLLLEPRLCEMAHWQNNLTTKLSQCQLNSLMRPVTQVFVASNRLLGQEFREQHAATIEAREKLQGSFKRERSSEFAKPL